MQLLQDSGLVEVSKDSKTHRPQTLCKLSAKGHKRFLEYIAELERVISDAARTVPVKAKGAFG